MRRLGNSNVNIMEGPWYQVTGPDFQRVRNDVRALLKMKYDCKKLDDTLERIVPESRNDFGSWQGYSVFAVAAQIAKEVESELAEKGGCTNV